MSAPLSLIRLWIRTIGIILLISLAILVVLIGYADYRFYSVAPADLPCRECTGEAKAVQVGGFDLYYREIGAAAGNAPVVILHGGPGHSSASFKGSLDFLGADRRVIYYDRRGSGYSQVKPDPALYTVEQLVEELETIRRDVIGADQIILIGHSAGGALAQRYVLAHGEHVEKLILISSIPINNAIGAPLLWNAFYPARFTVGVGAPPSDPEQANAWFTEVNVDTSAPRLYDAANRALIEDAGNVSFATWREVSRSLEGESFDEQLAQVEAPTLVLYGAADSGATGRAAATGLCGLLPHCTLVEFANSGHWPFLEEPQRFQEVIAEFLAQSP